jgi:hypothetical protein
MAEQINGANPPAAGVTEPGSPSSIVAAPADKTPFVSTDATQSAKRGSHLIIEGESNSSGRRPLVGRTNTIPGPVPLDPRAAAALVRVEEALRTMKPGDRAKFRELWSSAWVASFDRALPSAAAPDVANGKRMPAEIVEVTGSLGKMIEAGKVPFADTPEEYEAACMLFVIGMGQAVAGGAELPGLLWSRANALPPTKGDLVVFAVMSEAVREATGERSSLENWRALKDATNPIYRHLALQGARRAFRAEAKGISTESPRANEIIGAGRLAFYRGYLAETDPVIVASLIDAVAGVGSADARRTLEQMKAQQAQTANLQLMAKLNAALAELDRKLAEETDRH